MAGYQFDVNLIGLRFCILNSIVAGMVRPLYFREIEAGARATGHPVQFLIVPPGSGVRSGVTTSSGRLLRPILSHRVPSLMPDRGGGGDPDHRPTRLLR